jgi:hypothetical protein
MGKRSYLQEDAERTRHQADSKAMAALIPYVRDGSVRFVRSTEAQIQNEFPGISPHRPLRTPRR